MKTEKDPNTRDTTVWICLTNRFELPEEFHQKGSKMEKLQVQKVSIQKHMTLPVEKDTLLRY